MIYMVLFFLLVLLMGVVWLIDWLHVGFDEFCPHCGYYCTGKTVFCTKGTEKHE